MTYAIAKATRDQLDAEVSRLSLALKAFPKGPLNLTPDAVRLSPEYRAAKQAYDASWAKLRAFNAWFSKVYGAEIRADRNQRRPAVQA